MDISVIKESLVSRTFDVLDKDGNVADHLTVTWDRNLFTGELERRQGGIYSKRMTQLDSEIKKLYAPGRKAKAGEKSSALLRMGEETRRRKELDAITADVGREMLADTLARDRYGLIKSWDMTDGGKPVAPTFAVLVKQSPSFLGELLRWTRNESLPKGQPRAMLRPTMMSDSTNASSPSADTTPTAESPIM